MVVQLAGVCRVEGLDFDVATAAGWYSSIAGLLAGFAFVAVLLPLDHDDAEVHDNAAADAATVFVSAFFTLLLLSISYAVLAGRSGGAVVDGIAAHEQMLLGPTFGLSVLLLIFGLHVVLREYGSSRQVFRSADRVVMVTCSVLGPIVVLSLQFNNSLDLTRQRFTAAPDSECVAGFPPRVWLHLAITLAAIAALLLVALWRDRLPRGPAYLRVVSRIVLVSTVTVVVWTSIVMPLLPVAVITAATFESVVVVAAAVLVLAFSAASWASR